MHVCMCVMQVCVVVTFFRIHLMQRLVCVRVHAICRVCVSNQFVHASRCVHVHIYVLHACNVCVCVFVLNLQTIHLCVCPVFNLNPTVCVCVPHVYVVHAFVVHGACVTVIYPV
jgi:hypothetical protein